MKLFVVGSFTKPDKGMKLDAKEMVQLIGLGPELVVLDDSALNELRAKARKAAWGRIEQDEKLEHLREFKLEKEPGDAPGEIQDSQFWDQYIKLCDAELERLFELDHSPDGDDRYVFGNIDNDAVYAIEDLLLRVTGRDAIRLVTLPS